ncbi:MAG: UMP kinase [Alphaproteobacteria bacterium]|nr:UMP kinase [Alphaproteobacteria bacterium]MCR4556155.1 UMP kinase [Alphaproteobacteria bacterium]
MLKNFHRVLLKISGEFLMGDRDYGLDVKTVDRIAEEVKAIRDFGVEVCIVIGGGNIFRGVSAAAYGMHRAAADNIGMLATVMNSIAFQNSLERVGVDTRVMSAIHMPNICEPYIQRKAIRHLDKGRVVICAAGSGNPYFSTDTAAVLRALETNCETFIKATKVDGVFDSDPVKNPNAKFLEKLSYDEVIDKNIKIMDHTAITLAKENGIPMIVFSLKEKGNLEKVLLRTGKYSLII